LVPYALQAAPAAGHWHQAAGGGGAGVARASANRSWLVPRSHRPL